MSYCKKWCTCIIIFLALISLSENSSLSPTTIVVDQSGHSGFTTVQAAINSVPSNNMKWTTIVIGKGVYREQVVIPYDKPFIFLKGAGKEYTFIAWSAHGAAINITASFTSEANHTLAKDISFMNSYNSPPNGNKNPVVRAVAARILGDKSAFYRCGFYGLQDTLWDVQGRHYYKSCTIEGAIDFIFGAAQTLYESCSISVVAGGVNGTGYITAQRRDNPNNSNGFVFKECSIAGNGKVFLGRPWGDYARVLFYNTQMSDVIVPQGWDAWNAIGREWQLSLSEYKCWGPGAQTSKRVGWEKKLSDEEAYKLATISFIDDQAQGWVNQAIQILASL